MSFRRILGDSGLYVLGNVLRRGMSIITMPVFTRFLSPSGYGVLALVGTVQNLVEPLYAMGMQGAATRLYYEAPDAPARRRLFGTLLFVLVSRALPLTALLLMLGPWLWGLVVPDVPFTPYLLLTIVTAALGIVGILPRVIFRVEAQVPTFFRLSLVQASLAAALSVVLVVSGWGPLGPITGMLVAEAVFCAVYARHLWPHLALVLDRPTARRALRFGLPTLVVPIGAWIIKTSDRLLLQHFTSVAVVGLYSVGCSVSKIGLDLVGNAANWAVVPFVYATLTRVPEHRAKPTLARLATYNVAVLVGLALATVLYAKELIRIFASAAYAEAASVVPLVTTASMVQVLNYIPSRGISYREKTFYFPLIVGVGAAVSLALNFALIPWLGMQGAAIAMLASQTACLALTLPISQHLYPIPYEWARLVRLVLAAAATAGAVWLVPDTSPLLYQVIKAVFLLSFPGLLLLIGFVTAGEVRAAHRRLAAALRAAGRRGGRAETLAGRARRLLSPLAIAVYLVQFVAGEPGRPSGLTALQRLNEARRAMAATRGAGFPRAWRSLTRLARPGTVNPEAPAASSHRPVEPIA